ncbi:hypothetical protein BATDEDRAFT_24849 [Batrachochytrium dendrobatidis JAM81]|uniref:Uncharacterized protein n=2 Tax=Batrachochytrium dendrobatidis TaxID=109871 RepID=F4P378_BATDJ|nr:uncharacterized protein BATDEDRAFT_24849 [Batrachochytrium dendrobatidis JAM81]EGF80352.1 hypothetical protein BATDEDRAFT_24849 [Batrachochytrium dendrobatidis JAM81]OAJ41326.1 hypothetical protein BDEG_24947 [Batrachochytrium dendrobatidis JEL423]|eukprot:XP_006678943.1 hypothetical protein BATDEDRAFT_24849 [Batrachochytrium dendrobatidis JAM81]
MSDQSVHSASDKKATGMDEPDFVCMQKRVQLLARAVQEHILSSSNSRIVSTINENEVSVDAAAVNALNGNLDSSGQLSNGPSAMTDISKSQNEYMSAFNTLRLRRARELSNDISSVSNSNQPQTTRHTTAAEQSIHDQLANIEVMLHPTLQKIGQTQTVSRKRTQSVQSTFAKPEFNSFQFWGTLQSPLADISKLDSIIEVPNPEQILAKEYIKETLHGNIDTEGLEKRIELLEGIVKTQALQTQALLELHAHSKQNLPEPPHQETVQKNVIKTSTTNTVQIHNKIKVYTERMPVVQTGPAGQHTIHSHPTTSISIESCKPRPGPIDDTAQNGTVFYSATERDCTILNQSQLMVEPRNNASSSTQAYLRADKKDKIMVSLQPITGKAIAEPLIAQPYATQSSQAGQQEWIAYGDSWVTLEFYMKEKARREQEKRDAIQKSMSDFYVRDLQAVGKTMGASASDRFNVITPTSQTRSMQPIAEMNQNVLKQSVMRVTAPNCTVYNQNIQDQIIPDRMIESSRETLQDCHSARVISHPPLAQTISFKNMHREAQQPSIPRQKSMPNPPTAKTILVSVDPIKQTLNQSQTNLIKTATDPESKVEREPTFPKHCAITKQDMKIQVSEADPIPIGQSGTNAQNALSTTTLHDEDFDAILGVDHIPGTGKHNDLLELSSFIKPKQSSLELTTSEIKDTLPLSQKILKIFRWFNFLRSLCTAGYSLHTAIMALQNPYMIELHAVGFWAASIVFVIVDILVAALRAFPKTLWFCWDVRHWDPLEKTWSPWALVADHDLIIDVLPILANVVLKVYGYRLTEIVANPNARNSITQTQYQFSDFTNPQNSSLILLVLFGIALFYTVMFHTIRLWRVTTFVKKNPILGILVVIKAMLLLFDILTNALLLYQILVYSGLRLLSADRQLQLMLAVVVPSPIITLTTNTLLNLPMHFTMLRVQLQGKRDSITGQSGDSVDAGRVFRTAMRRTFHPAIVIVFGSYATFSTVALFILLGIMLGFDPIAQIQAGHVPPGVIPTSGFFGWGGGQDGLYSGSNVLLGMVWVNLVSNYLVGVLSALAYWTFALGYGIYLAIFRFYRT